MIASSREGGRWPGTWLRRINRENALRFFAWMAGAVFYIISFPPLELTWAGWLVPLCWIWACRGATSRERVVFGFLAGLLVYVIITWWLSQIFSVLAVFLWAVPALYVAAWAMASGWKPFGSSGWMQTLWAAVCWGGLEYFRGEVSPVLCFSWGTLGYSQTGRLGMGFHSVAGVYGTSFLLVLWAGIFLGGCRRLIQGQARMVVIPGLFILASLPVVSTVPVPGWTGDNWGTARLRQLRQVWFPAPSAVIQRDCSLVVWPEYCLFDSPYEPENERFRKIVERESGRGEWGMLFGATDYRESGASSGKYWNTIYYLNPEGRVIGKAVKNQPIQLIRDGLPAEDISVLPVESTSVTLKMGVGVCYDGTFQRYACRMRRKGADFLVFPLYNAEDWGVWQHRQHQRMLQTRAAENGCALLTAAVSGPTFAASPGGGVIRELPLVTQAELVAPIPKSAGLSWFSRGGWLAGPALLGGLVLMLILAALQGRRERREAGGRTTVPAREETGENAGG